MVNLSQGRQPERAVWEWLASMQFIILKFVPKVTLSQRWTSANLTKALVRVVAASVRARADHGQRAAVPILATKWAVAGIVRGPAPGWILVRRVRAGAPGVAELGRGHAAGAVIAGQSRGRAVHLGDVPLRVTTMEAEPLVSAVVALPPAVAHLRRANADGQTIFVAT